MIPCAVLFDLDDTLFDHRHCARTALEAVRASHAAFAGVDRHEFEASHSRHLEALHLQVLAGAIRLDDARRERFRRLFEDAGVRAGDDLVHATAIAYRDCYMRSWQPVPGAGPLLRALQGRARIGVVSNNLHEEQIQKIRHCGFDQYLDSVVISERAGVTKPDPAIFRMALDELGCGAGHAVMVGDSWTADVAGARAAGIRAVWFNRSGAPKPEPADDVAELRALEPVDDAITVVLEASGVARGQR